MLHLKPEFIGLVMALNGIIIGLVEMAYVFALEQRKKDIHYMALGGVFMSVSFLVYNFLPGYMSLAIISMLLCTLGEMTTMPFMNSFMISRTQPSNRGQYAGLTTAAWSVAQILGPFFGTRIADNNGFTELWFVMGALCVINAIGFKWLEKMVKEEQLGVGSLSK
jgi:predicted MFS family arabinose efflux permease